MTPGFLLKFLSSRISLLRVRKIQKVQVQSPSVSFATAATSSKKRVIKKPYAELPVRLVTAEGELSSPLPEWQGGLYTPVEHTNNQTTEELLGAPSGTTPGGERKKRARRTVKKPEATVPSTENLPPNSPPGYACFCCTQPYN